MTYYISTPTIEARRRLMRRLIENSFDSDRALTFPMELSSTPEEYILSALLPGLAAEEVNIQFNNGVLTIDGQYSEKRLEGNEYHLAEFPVGKFSRSIEIKDAVKSELIEAVMKQGILIVHIPKAEEAKPKTIKIVSEQN
jgi:HSP20 family protein